MKLEPIAKPVRIRITSNGKEHTDLASLRENFCIDDVYKSYTEKCLVKWLRQIKEDDLAFYLNEIDTKKENEFEKKLLLCFLMFNPPKNKQVFEQLCFHVDEVQMSDLLSRISANDELQDYINRYVDSEVLETLIESEDSKVKIVAKVELGQRCFDKAQKTEPRENKLNLYNRAFELGYLPKDEKFLRAQDIEVLEKLIESENLEVQTMAKVELGQRCFEKAQNTEPGENQLNLYKRAFQNLDFSEYVINEIRNQDENITLQDVAFFKRLKATKCSEIIEEDELSKLSKGFIRAIAEYVNSTIYTINQIKRTNDFGKFDCALFIFRPKNGLIDDFVTLSIHLLMLLPGLELNAWTSIRPYTNITLRKRNLNTINRTEFDKVAKAFFDKYDDTIKNRKYSPNNVCELLQDLAYYSIFTE